jgi:hypothetical protein
MGKRFEPRTDHNGLKNLFDKPTLNARKRRWLEFISEYDFDIKHIKGKENKVVDALNKRVHELHSTTINMYKSDLKHKILEAANLDLQYKELVEKLQQGNLQHKIEEYKLDNDEILMYSGKIYVPNSHELKNLILREMHNVPYVGYPGYRKTIATIKSQYYWPGMKKEAPNFIAKCLECQKVKDEHRHPASLLEPLPILEWKWEVVTMNFITKIPRTNNNLTKAPHFIPVNSTHKATNIVDIYMREIDRLHGIPKTIVFDKDPILPQIFGRYYLMDLEQI